MTVPEGTVYLVHTKPLLDHCVRLLHGMNRHERVTVLQWDRWSFDSFVRASTRLVVVDHATAEIGDEEMWSRVRLHNDWVLRYWGVYT